MLSFGECVLFEVVQVVKILIIISLFSLENVYFENKFKQTLFFQMRLYIFSSNQYSPVHSFELLKLFTQLVSCSLFHTICLQIRTVRIIQLSRKLHNPFIYMQVICNVVHLKLSRVMDAKQTG